MRALIEKIREVISNAAEYRNPLETIGRILDVAERRAPLPTERDMRKRLKRILRDDAPPLRDYVVVMYMAQDADFTGVNPTTVTVTSSTPEK